MPSQQGLFSNGLLGLLAGIKNLYVSAVQRFVSIGLQLPKMHILYLFQCRVELNKGLSE
jgi:hypothetical protein